mgnify:FL=1
MKKITLGGIRDSLANLESEVLVDSDVADRARIAVQRMLEVKV